MGVPAFQAMRMLSGELPAAAGRHADDQRDTELPARHMAKRRRVVDDLIEGQQAEVDRHDFDDGPQPAQGRADPGTDEGRFRQRRVAHPLRAELFQQALAARVRAAVAADILAHQEHARVAPQGFAQPGSDSLAIGHGRHGATGVVNVFQQILDRLPRPGLRLATASSISAATAVSISARSASEMSPSSRSRDSSRTSGSRCFHCSTSSLER